MVNGETWQEIERKIGEKKLFYSGELSKNII